MRLLQLFTFAILIGAFGLTIAHAEDYDLWHTIDGGGAMFTTGGDFELSGTIGQPDASLTAMTGGSFELAGGFWVVAVPTGCTCPGDVNGDTLLNGADIQAFTDCVLAGGNCSCAELDGMPGLDDGDAAVLVNDLLSGASCP